MSTYWDKLLEIWTANRIVGCNEKNDYAEPNRQDGTYICFQCRS